MMDSGVLQPQGVPTNIPIGQTRIADVDGDGDSDLLLIRNPDFLGYLESDGSGALTLRTATPTEVPNLFSGFGIGDFDGDGATTSLHGRLCSVWEMVVTLPSIPWI